MSRPQRDERCEVTLPLLVCPGSLRWRRWLCGVTIVLVAGGRYVA